MHKSAKVFCGSWKQRSVGAAYDRALFPEFNEIRAVTDRAYNASGILQRFPWKEGNEPFSSARPNLVPEENKYENQILVVMRCSRDCCFVTFCRAGSNIV
jgi:hypothetical protein